MFGLGSSSSSSSTSSGPNSNSRASEPPAAPNREQRLACWTTRDAYFDCLTKNGMLRPGDEVSPSDGKGAGVNGSGFCGYERGEYERNCGKSWIDYFNKRRTLELRQQATIDAAAKQTAQARR